MAKKTVKKVVKRAKEEDTRNNMFKQFQFSNDLKKARREKKLTLRVVATKVKVPVTTLHWMEKGNHTPNMEYFARVVSFYDMKPADYIKA